MIQFTEIVKKTVEQTFNDTVSDRLMNAINQTKPTEDSMKAKENEEESDENKLITTEDEINSFYIVKSILRTKIDFIRNSLGIRKHILA